MAADITAAVTMAVAADTTAAGIGRFNQSTIDDLINSIFQHLDNQLKKSQTGSPISGVIPQSLHFAADRS
ncbi:hypothetical protein QS257_18375 [Terrilactibacillus sp. S3-3]|nr:hypothetical protein QS257_18375 [Terrilactibacillus sp. S3-3]